MPIRFQFRIEKSVEAIAYLLSKLGGRRSRSEVLKLLFFADLGHLLKHGRPITGDLLSAMKRGPVLSETYDAIKGELLDPEGQALFDQFLKGENNIDVVLKEEPSYDSLSESDIEVLDEVIREHGSLSEQELVDETHAMAEYREVFPDGTERLRVFLPYDLFLERRASPEIKALVEEQQQIARILR